MKKDTALALAIVAFGTACYVAIGAEWPTPPPGMAYETDLKPHSLVVTNVVLDGVATTADLDAKRDKTDLTVYGLVTNSYRLAKECLPVRGYIVREDRWSELDITSWETTDWPDPEGPFEKILTAKRSDGASYFSLLIDEGGRPIYEDGLVAFSMTYGGKPFKEYKWPILEPVTGISPTADTLATTSTVAKVARSVVNTVWDSELGVAWEARMHNGQLYYVAVTNRPPEGK